MWLVVLLKIIPGTSYNVVIVIDCFVMCYTLTVFFFFNSFSAPDHHEHICPPDDSTLQLLDPSHHITSQEMRGEGNFCSGDKAEDITQSM